MQEALLKARATLVFPVTDTHVLLGRKQRKAGKGKWNGYGGGIEEGESVRATACSELWQEALIKVSEKDLQYATVIDAYNRLDNDRIFHCRVHTFITEHWTGDPQETEEMRSPTWFPQKELPLDEMMIGDPTWLPLVFSSKFPFRTEIWFGPGQRTLEREIRITPSTEEYLSRL